MDTKDYERLMQANIERVFNERDPAKRLQAIREIYAPDAVLYEPETLASGHAAISAAVADLQAHMPPDFAFSVASPALGHHDLGRLRWQGKTAAGAVLVNGMDVAHFNNGVIQSLHVFIEPN